ncbi:hypothetical protein TraAM80_01681 [Trypanosoma rangeli]|uniref:Uncharacterized protein n=1 Tax=Trypanosoma rangeli TaxID=5698 RepID=A0A3S5IS84_TRYRA|nr:uncharacterized protein TraAM80_01681 [Trypanosoma rangeli]RNF10242.1 hypothetical protein TraAM80_01681 [Trypanosoma rangeli]|eukprot:RNF10242.1 hypothetical protein TraAM80_01681 [Trypanosoma rangeli]
MSSYCEVCRGLFDIPHHHRGDDDDGDAPVRVPGAASPLETAAPPSTAMPGCGRRDGLSGGVPCPRCGSSQPPRLGSTYRRASSSLRTSPAVGRERSGSRRRTPSTPSARGVARDTASSLLRMSPSVRASALVRTPSPGRFLRPRGVRASTTPRHPRSGRRSSSAGHVAKERMTRRWNHLQETLERIREAVRKDAAAVERHGDGGWLAGLGHLDNNCSNSINTDEVGVDDASLQPALCGSTGHQDAEVQDMEHCRSFPCSSGLSFATSQRSLPAADAQREVTETHAHAEQDSAFLQPSSPSYERCSSMRQGPPPPLSSTVFSQPPTSAVVAHAAGPDIIPPLRSTAALSAEMRTSETPTPTSPEGGWLYSSSLVGRGTRTGDSDAAVSHLEALRGGFVELCSAVREDLHALHTRVNGLQRQQAEIQQQQQQQQHQQPSMSVCPPAWQLAGSSHETAEATAREPQFPIPYEKLLAELQQYTVLTVHKVLQQQQQQRQEQKEPYFNPYGYAQAPPEAMPFSSSHSQPTTQPLPQWSSVAVGDMYGLLPEAFDAHVRSAVRFILQEDSFRRDTEDVLAQQRAQRRDLKASRRECKRHCAALEEQLAAIAETVDSTRLDVEELRLQTLPPPPPPPAATASAPLPQPPLVPLTSGAEPYAAVRAATTTNAVPAVWEDRLVQRVERLIADSEERCLQRVRGEVMRPVLGHVRRLMSAHQSMIETIVESRCAQFEAYVDRSRHGWEVQLAGLRSRVGSLRGDMHRALRDLCESLNVACPGL